LLLSELFLSLRLSPTPTIFDEFFLFFNLSGDDLDRVSRLDSLRNDTSLGILPFFTADATDPK